MAKCKKSDPDDGIERLAAIMRELKSSPHYAKPKSADGAWHHEPMLQHAATESDGAKHHCQGQSDLMDDRRSKDAASARKQAERNSRPKAMHEAEPGDRDADPVEESGLDKLLRHRRIDIAPSQSGYNITYDHFDGL